MALRPSSQKVQDALRRVGSTARVEELPASARTAPEAAAALGVDVGQIAKSLVFLSDGAPLVVIVSGADRVDEDRLAAHVGARAVVRADPGTVREATGFAIGGVSPAGQPEGVRILVDRGLEAFGEIWAAAGTPQSVFRTSYDELIRISGGESADVRQERRGAAG